MVGLQLVHEALGRVLESLLDPLAVPIQILDETLHLRTLTPASPLLEAFKHMLQV